MKRSPECGREYDNTMMFCLDDGAELLYGPASMDEPATAILHSTAAPGEAPTRAQINITNETAILPDVNYKSPTQTVSRKNSLIAGVLGILLVTGLGIGSYFYYGQRSGKQIESIAVMPFVNESGNADVEYLSDGMTETLITSLSQLPNLNVKARSTVFRYKGKDTDAKTIGKELNVQAVLKGRVLQRGDQLTLSLELIDVVTENVIWSDKYDRKQSDLVSLQNEIARDVLSKLKTKLSGADDKKLAKNYTNNTEAYKLYLQGRFYWNKRGAENIEKAIQQFKQAADKDPNYALAYVGLADSYVLLPENKGTPTSEALPQAKAYANRALEIDDLLAEAHASLGIINHLSWNWAESEKEFKRAIELKPNYATAHHWYSRYLRTMGRSDEAMAEIGRAKESDPLSTVIMVNAVQTYLEAGDVDSAYEQARKAIELDPEHIATHQNLAYVYIKQGRTDLALAETQRMVELSKKSNGSLGLLSEVQARLGNRNEAHAAIRELEERYAKSQVAGGYIAAAYSQLVEKDKAFAWLEKDFQAHSTYLVALKHDLEFAGLRDDPRYKDLLQRMGLPE